MFPRSSSTSSEPIPGAANFQNLSGGITAASSSASTMAPPAVIPPTRSVIGSLVSADRPSLTIEFREQDIPPNAVYVRTRHNSLRCFPRCSPIHKRKSFCGYPLYVTITFDKRLPLHGEDERSRVYHSGSSSPSSSSLYDSKLALVGEFRNVSKEARFPLGSRQDHVPSVSLNEFASGGMMIRSTSTSSATPVGESSSGVSTSKRKTSAGAAFFVARLYKHEESPQGIVTLSYIFMPPGKWHCQGKMREIDDHVFTASLVVEGRVIAQQDSARFRIKRIWKMPGESYNSSSLEDAEDDLDEELGEDVEEKEDLPDPKDHPRQVSAGHDQAKRIKPYEEPEMRAQEQRQKVPVVVSHEEERSREEEKSSVSSSPPFQPIPSSAGFASTLPSRMPLPSPSGPFAVPSVSANDSYSYMLHAMIQQQQQSLLAAALAQQQHQHQQFYQGSPMMDESHSMMTQPLQSPVSVSSLLPQYPVAGSRGTIPSTSPPYYYYLSCVPSVPANAAFHPAPAPGRGPSPQLPSQHHQQHLFQQQQQEHQRIMAAAMAMQQQPARQEDRSREGRSEATGAKKAENKKPDA